LEEKRNPLGRTLFSESDRKSFPGLEGIEGDFLAGTNQLFLYLLDDSELHKDASRSFFDMAKEKFDAISPEGGDARAFKAMSAFLEFMTTDGVEGFKVPTYWKHRYEVFGPAPVK